jgi:hypothetical protein
MEIEGKLHKMIVFVKMYAGNYSKAIRENDIASNGVTLQDPDLSQYRNFTSGRPEGLALSRTGEDQT